MSTDPFEQALADLNMALDEAIELLSRFGQDRWRDWLSQDRERLGRGDGNAVDHLLSAFGGMGSFNDVVLYESRGLGDRPARVSDADERLWELRETIWTTAKAIRRDLDSAK